MSPAYEQKYGAARAIGALIAFIGWVVVFLGVAGAAYAVALGSEANQEVELAIIAGAGAFAILFALLGLLLAGAGQLLRATADNSNNTGEMLALMKGVRVPTA